jgi:hypothetical protein
MRSVARYFKQELAVKSRDELLRVGWSVHQLVEENYCLGTQGRGASAIESHYHMTQQVERTQLCALANFEVCRDVRAYYLLQL